MEQMLLAFMGDHMLIVFAFIAILGVIAGLLWRVTVWLIRRAAGKSEKTSPTTKQPSEVKRPSEPTTQQAAPKETPSPATRKASMTTNSEKDIFQTKGDESFWKIADDEIKNKPKEDFWIKCLYASDQDESAAKKLYVPKRVEQLRSGKKGNESFWKIAHDEIKGAPEQGMWVKCLHACDHDESEAKKLYVPKRVEQLQAAENEKISERTTRRMRKNVVKADREVFLFLGVGSFVLTIALGAYGYYSSNYFQPVLIVGILLTLLFGWLFTRSRAKLRELKAQE